MIEDAKLRPGFGGVKDSGSTLQNPGSVSGTHRLSCPLDSYKPSGERAGLQIRGPRNPVSRCRPHTQVTSEVKVAQSCPTLCDPIDYSPWDSPDKNIGVGCHFLLWGMKVKSESKVAQSCPTQRSHGLQPTRLLRPWDFSRQEYWSGVHLPSPKYHWTKHKVSTLMAFPIHMEQKGH